MAKGNTTSQQSGFAPDTTNLAQAQLLVNGMQTAFCDLQITQTFADHNHFHIILDPERTGKNFICAPEEYISLTGKPIEVSFRQGKQGESFSFSGIIQRVAIVSREGKFGFIDLTAASPTILMERGLNCDVHAAMTLNQLYKTATEGLSDDLLHPIINTSYTDTIDFSMQYNETDWHYLQRLAAEYAENLYFNGQNLVFGQLEDNPPLVQIVYDQDLKKMELISRMQPTAYGAGFYNSSSNQYNINKGAADPDESESYLKQVVEASDTLTDRKSAFRQIHAGLPNGAELNNLMDRFRQGSMAQCQSVEGEIKTCRGRLGSLLKIVLPQAMGGKQLGVYRISKITHRIDETGAYRGTFRAIPSTIGFIPGKKVDPPFVDSLTATVWGNNDPQKLGRVKVEFPFGKQPACQAWFPVMTPQGGVSEAVTANRGLFFIPEPGDKVMLGFRHNHPSSPYVKGSLFHKDNTSGIQPDNTLKTLSTRSGIKIEFDDKQGSLLLSDAGGNTYFMDGKGNILIKAKMSSPCRLTKLPSMPPSL